MPESDASQPKPAPDERVPRRNPRHRRRVFWRRLAAASVLALLLLEAGLRLFDVDVPMAKIWRWHDTLGWTQHPAQTLDYEMAGYRVHAEFNSLGFRDVEHALAKPRGTRRIVVVGDSICEAVQVNLEETFHRRLEVLLDARGGADHEVINLGVGDWGTAQQWLVLRELGLRFEPDVVVCQILPLNDIGNNGIELYGLCQSHNDLYRPYFVERDGELVETRRHPLLHELRRASRVFRNVERLWHAAAWRLAPGSDRDRWRARMRDAGYPGLAPLLHAYVPEPQQPPPIQRAWRVTELLLERMVQACREHGVAFLAVVIAFEACVGDAWPDFARQQPPPAMDPDYPDRRLAALFGRLGVPVVITKPIFEANLAVYRPCRDGHLNPEGHRLVAEALAAAIDADRLLGR